MVQLIESCSVDHSSGIAQTSVRANAGGRGGQSQPKLAAVTFYLARQGAIVNDLVANGGQASKAVQDFGAKQDASASGAGRLALGIGNPLRRIKLEEEKNKCRNHKPFGQSLAMQFHHVGSQVVRTGLG